MGGGLNEGQVRGPLGYRLFAGAVLWWLFLLALQPSFESHADQQREDVLFDLVYGVPDSAQTLDLYLPDRTGTPSPVLIYVHGGFWGHADEHFLRDARASTRLAWMGVAVAIPKLRSPRQSPWPATLDDLAAVVAYLKREAPRLDLDPGRIYLVGHSSGGFAVSRFVFADEVLRKAGLRRNDIAGVVTLGGMHDLGGPAVVDHVKEMTYRTFGAMLPAADLPPSNNGDVSPPFLVISAEKDPPGFALDAQAFARGVRRGHAAPVTYQIVPGANHAQIGDLGTFGHTFARELVLDFMDVSPMDAKMGMLVRVDNQVFFGPPFSTEPFWHRLGGLVRDYPVDEAFLNALHAHILESRYQLGALPLKTYHAIPVAALVDTLPGKGDFLVTRNVRNERYHWSLREMLRYDPVIVVGIDHERNLFHFGIPYQNRREYSWVEHPEPMPVAFRALGGWVHFRKAPPEALQLKFSADMSLTVDGFALEEAAPLTLARDTIPEVLKPVVTYANGCYSCHSLGGVGSAAFHNRFDTGEPQGGFALPLEDYPPAVWRRFVFQQTVAAGLIGVTPNLIAEIAQEPLYELVEKARAERARAEAGAM